MSYPSTWPAGQSGCDAVPRLTSQEPTLVFKVLLTCTAEGQASVPAPSVICDSISSNLWSSIQCRKGYQPTVAVAWSSYGRSHASGSGIWALNQEKVVPQGRAVSSGEASEIGGGGSSPAVYGPLCPSVRQGASSWIADLPD